MVSASSAVSTSGFASASSARMRRCSIKERATGLTKMRCGSCNSVASLRPSLPASSRATSVIATLAPAQGWAVRSRVVCAAPLRVRACGSVSENSGALNSGCIGAPAGAPMHPLFKAPEFSLTLPQARTRSGAAQTTRDLTSHPWAGAKVAMTLVARDEAGNDGRSEATELQLPQRIFVKPVARALIEQRRILALDADAKPLVLTALDALTIAPERFTPETAVYLGLRSIYFDLAHAKSDDQLREVVARMWDMATQLEDGNVSQSELALRQAQDALRQALERGATDQELKKLMDDLRAAMDKYLQALAEEMKKNPQQLARPLDRNTRMLTQRDLKSMLDRLENLARSGNKDAARQLLEELQSMLENLQMARPGAQGEEGDDDMMSALDELGDMIRKQQQLRDKTFKQGQDMRRDRQRQQQGQGQQQLGDLRQDQQGLRDRLNKLLEQLRQQL